MSNRTRLALALVAAIATFAFNIVPMRALLLARDALAVLPQPRAAFAGDDGAMDVGEMRHPPSNLADPPSPEVTAGRKKKAGGVAMLFAAGARDRPARAKPLVAGHDALGHLLSARRRIEILAAARAEGLAGLTGACPAHRSKKRGGEPAPQTPERFSSRQM